jgi:hemerythrin
MATLIAEAPVGTEDLDAEHALQYKLLAEVERLMTEDNEAAARDVIRRLYEYSEAHFASEQVLMRLHSYPEYLAHEREHGDLLDALQSLLSSVGVEDSSTSASSLRRWLSGHIHHADRAFVDFLKANAAPGDAQLTR